MPADSPVAQPRDLALAYFIERGIDAGEFLSYGDAARRIGITAGRVTQLMNLLLLAPEVQGGLLSGKLDCGERKLREIATTPRWEEQVLALRVDSGDRNC